MTPLKLFMETTNDPALTREWVALCLPETERHLSGQLPIEAIAALYPETEKGPNYQTALQLAHRLKQALADNLIDSLAAHKSIKIINEAITQRTLANPFVAVGHSVSELILLLTNLDQIKTGIYLSYNHREHMKWFIMYTWLQPFLHGDDEKEWTAQAKKMCALSDIPYKETGGRVTITI